MQLLQSADKTVFIDQYKCKILVGRLFAAALRIRFNPLVTNGLSHTYHLDEFTSIFKGIRSNKKNAIRLIWVN